MVKNYLEIKSYSVFSLLYIFVDTFDHIFERIMEDEGIVMKHITEYSKSGSPYRLISCRINKRDKKEFCELLMQIRNTALLLGYKDYDEMCVLMQKAKD